MRDANELSELAARATGLWFLDLGPWDLFATLTFRRRRSPNAALDDMRWYLRETQRRLGRTVEIAIAVIEYHRSGNLHLHALLKVSHGIRTREIRLIRDLWIRRFGLARIEQPADQEAVTKYVSKYAGGSRDPILIWPDRVNLLLRRVRASAS